MFRMSNRVIIREGFYLCIVCEICVNMVCNCLFSLSKGKPSTYLHSKGTFCSESVKQF